MIEKYRAGVVPEATIEREELEGRVKFLFKELPHQYEEKLNDLNFSEALSRVWAVVREINAYVDKAAPWKEKDEATLSTVLATLAEGLRILAVYAWPVIPGSAEKIWESLGTGKGISVSRFDDAVVWGNSLSGVKTSKMPPLFPRIQ